MPEPTTTADAIQAWAAQLHPEVKISDETVTNNGTGHHNSNYAVAFDTGVICKRCDVRKPKTDYYPARKGNGIRQPCKPCHSRQRREAYRTSDEPNQVWRRNLARYGLTEADYERMLAEQDGLCATCRRPQSAKGKRLGVDHNHTTGQVRQLLCDPCNFVVGYIETHDVPLDALAAYVARHNAPEAAS